MIQQEQQQIQITCTNTAQYELLANINIILHFDVVITRSPRQMEQQQTEASLHMSIEPTGQRYHKCVIKNVPTHITEAEIAEETEASYAQRMIKKLPKGQAVSLPVVILSYHVENTIPSRVHIGYSVHETTPYIPKPIWCNRCQRFGHITTKCRALLVKCSYCSGDHQYTQCPVRAEQQQPKCANCQGAQRTVQLTGMLSILPKLTASS